MTGTITVGWLNTHNEGPAIRYMLNQMTDSLGLAEVSQWNTFLAKRALYLLHYQEGGSDQRRGFKDNPVLTRRRYPVLGSLFIQASEPAVPARIATSMKTRTRRMSTLRGNPRCLRRHRLPVREALRRMRISSVVIGRGGRGRRGRVPMLHLRLETIRRIRVFGSIDARV